MKYWMCKSHTDGAVPPPPDLSWRAVNRARLPRPASLVQLGPQPLNQAHRILSLQLEEVLQAPPLPLVSH